MPERPTIRTRAKLDPMVRSLLEGVMKKFGDADRQALLKEIARGKLALKDMEAESGPLPEDLARLRAEIEELEGQYDIVRKDGLVAEEREQELLATLERVRQERVEDRSKYEKKISAIEGSIHSMKEEVSRTLQRERTTYRMGKGAVEQKDELKGKVETLEAKSEKAEESLRAREVMLNDLQTRLESERGTHEAQVADLLQKTEELGRKLVEAMKSVGAEAKLDEISLALEDAEGALQARQTALESQARELKRLEKGASASDRHQKTVRILESEVNRSAERAASLEKDNEFLRGRLEEEAEAHRAKVESLRARSQGPVAPGAPSPGGGTGDQTKLKKKLALAEAEAKKWEEAFKEKAGDLPFGGPEGRIVELEIAVAREELQHEEEVEALQAKIRPLERDVNRLRKSEEALKADVREITALAKAERDGLLEVGGAEKTSAGQAPSGEGTAEVEAEIDRLGEEAEAMRSKADKIEDASVGPKGEGDGSQGKVKAEMSSRSAEITKTLKALSESLDADAASSAGSRAEEQQVADEHREKQEELLERMTKIREDLASLADDSP